MRAVYMYGAGDVRVIDVPEPTIKNPTDAIVRVVRSCICGSDLHPYHRMKPSETGRGMGHEFIGVVEDIGIDVSRVREGDFVIAPFKYSDGTCEFCQEGLQTSCRHGGGYGEDGPAGQAEFVRVPQADGTLYVVPNNANVHVDGDSKLLPDLLTLSDVYGTGFHAAYKGGAAPGKTVTVIGDGAVGLLAVLSATQLGAEQIILMGRHQTRTNLGKEFGATHVVPERGAEGVEHVKKLTGGDGTHVVIEAVGNEDAYTTGLEILRPGGTFSRVGVPQFKGTPEGFDTLFWKNGTMTGGVAPVRAYIDRLLPAILNGSAHPGRVFDRSIGIEDAPDGYRAMDQRESLKVQLTFP